MHRYEVKLLSKLASCKMLHLGLESQGLMLIRMLPIMLDKEPRKNRSFWKFGGFFNVANSKVSCFIDQCHNDIFDRFNAISNDSRSKMLKKVIQQIKTEHSPSLRARLNIFNRIETESKRLPKPLQADIRMTFNQVTAGNLSDRILYRFGKLFRFIR